mmetsp:Transcript_39247/g.76160  ORF Transcript_39247/g.76160 Transcript_39247/m.76160 type:complete len:98 (+) Transcript_39247:63-356(+)
MEVTMKPMDFPKLRLSGGRSSKVQASEKNKTGGGLKGTYMCRQTGRANSRQRTKLEEAIGGEFNYARHTCARSQDAEDNLDHCACWCASRSHGVFMI